MAKVMDFNDGLELSILDQICSRSYTRLLYCFSLPVAINEDETQSLVERFRHATNQIIGKWPFLGSKIRLRDPKEPAGEVELFWTRDRNPLPIDKHRWFSTDGVLRFKGVEEWGAKGAPNYSDLVSRGVPPSMLGDHEFCHVPHEPSLEARKGWPVYQITVNFTRGGLMLCICFANSVIDSYAHGIIFEEFAKQVRDWREPVNGMDKSVGQTQYRSKQIDMTALAGVNIDWTRESCPELLPPTPPSLKGPVGPAGITASSKYGLSKYGLSKSKSSKSKSLESKSSKSKSSESKPSKSKPSKSKSSESKPSKSKPPSVTGRVFSFPMEVLERQQQLLHTHFCTDTAGRPKVTYQLGEILVAWVWGSMVRARIREDTEDTKGRHLPFSKHVPTLLTFSMNVRSQLGIPDGEKYLRNAILYNCVELKSSDMIRKEGMEPGKILHRVTRTFHNRAQSFDAKAVRIRLEYMSRIWEHPGSVEYQADSADENDVIVDWLLAPGRQTYFGSALISGQTIELGQPEFVRELPGSHAPGRCAVLPRNLGHKVPFEVYIQLDEDAMERLTERLKRGGVRCIQ